MVDWITSVTIQPWDPRLFMFFELLVNYKTPEKTADAILLNLHPHFRSSLLLTMLYS